MVKFGSRNKGIPLLRRDAIPLTLTNLIIFSILTLVFVQMIGLLFNLTTIKLGPVFILIAVGMAASMSIAVFRKVASDHLELTKKDVFAILITVVIALVMMFFLRDFVPEIFDGGVSTLASFVGI